MPADDGVIRVDCKTTFIPSFATAATIAKPGMIGWTNPTHNVEVTQASLEIAPTGQLDVSGPVTFGDGSQLVMGMADDAMVGIVADEVTIDGNSSLKLAISGKALFKGGYHHVFINAPNGLSGMFPPESPDLSHYGDLTYTSDVLTLTLSYDLHSGDANLDPALVPNPLKQNTWRSLWSATSVALVLQKA